MSSDEDQRLNNEVVETKRKDMGKAGLEACHFSDLLRRIIIQDFQGRKSSRRTAQALGLGVAAVRDVIALETLRRTPTPTSNVLMFPRRAA
jgi:hypothetical protein